MILQKGPQHSSEIEGKPCAAPNNLSASNFSTQHNTHTLSLLSSRSRRAGNPRRRPPPPPPPPSRQANPHGPRSPPPPPAAMEAAFDAYFRAADLDRDGRISGQEAVAFFKASALPQPVLAQVFNPPAPPHIDLAFDSPDHLNPPQFRALLPSSPADFDPCYLCSFLHAPSSHLLLPLTHRCCCFICFLIQSLPFSVFFYYSYLPTTSSLLLPYGLYLFGVPLNQYIYSHIDRELYSSEECHFLLSFIIYTILCPLLPQWAQLGS